MSTKYTPLGSSDDHRNDVSEIPPSYELDDVETGPSRAAANFSPPQPLTVKFYQEVFKTIDLELNYYPHLGVKGIHDTVKRKLDSIEIELEDDNYLIGVRDGYKFRYICIDDDRVGDNVHYFKSGDQAVVENLFQSFRTYDIVACIVLILFAVFGYYYFIRFLTSS